jgi:aspartate aminotransferase-like enzyme
VVAECRRGTGRHRRGGSRQRLLTEFNIEIGAGLGSLAGRIWRVGLMGSGSTAANVQLMLTRVPTRAATPRYIGCTLAADR